MEYLIYVKGVFVFLLLLSISIHLRLPILQLKPPLDFRPCQNPVQRKEWSAATDAERSSYIDAVLCLATKPSRIGLNSTLYDDFAYVHSLLETVIHGTALFLPWHRYFIHIYEGELHGCGYTSAAMYWDWVADSAAPSKARVWSSVDGFGGNGTKTNPSNPTAPFCVLDGPFQHLRPYYKDNITDPHCLSRDFMDGYPDDNLQEMLGYAYSPPVIATVLASVDYVEFYENIDGLHESVHAGISQSTNGDMGLLTAPNDPIFFLHHTQLDRIWWLWQQANPNRLVEYAGNRAEGSSALLTDFMPMLDMAPDRQVRDFMSTETADLCYEY